MKPFLILQLRPNDTAENDEFQAFLRYANLDESNVHRIRMTKDPLPETINLNDYSALIVGGGPSDVSKPEEKKSSEQRRFEPWLQNLLTKIVEADFPYLGCCYGLGALAINIGGTVSKENYAEPVSAVDITLSPEAHTDPLLKDLPQTFRAIVGHKEAVQTLPDTVTTLASSPTCPTQLIRLKQNIYATQFHPELDAKGIAIRIDIYKNEGYFPAEEAEPLKASLKQESITIPEKVLKRFVKTYSKN